MHISLTGMTVGAVVAVDQAAAEYVGTALSGALRSVGNGLRSAGRKLGDEPLLLIAAIVAVIVLLRLLGRRRL